MARDLNRFIRERKERVSHHKAEFEYICNKYAQQNEDEENWVVDLSSMDFIGDKSGCTDEISRLLTKMTSSRDQVPSQPKKLQDEADDAEQWLSGEEDEKQMNILKDMSNCMYYDSQESEPSDGETLGSRSSDSVGESDSDYSMDDTGEEKGSFGDEASDNDVGLGRQDNPRVSRVDSLRKEFRQRGEPVQGDTYIITGDKQPAGSIERPQEIRHSTDRREDSNNAYRRRSKYADNRSTDFYNDTPDSLMPQKEPNNNFLKSNTNYLTHDRASDSEFNNPHQQIPEPSKEHFTMKENRRSGLTHSYVNQSNERLGRNPYTRSLDKTPVVSEDYSQSLETEAHYNDSMVVRPGSQYSSGAPSNQGTSSDGAQHQNYKGLWEVTNPLDEVEGQSELVYHGTYGTEGYVDLAKHSRSSEKYDRRHDSSLSNEKRDSHRYHDPSAPVRQAVMAETRHLDTNASPYNAISKNDRYLVSEGIPPIANLDPEDIPPFSNLPFNGRFEKEGMSSGLKNLQNCSESPKSSPVNNCVLDSTFDKKDSGISSFMEDTHSTDTGLKVLSLKNLKTFNESFTEKSIMNVSMNHSYSEQKAENENKEKVKQWLDGFRHEKRDYDRDEVTNEERHDYLIACKANEERKKTPVLDRSHKRHTSGNTETADSSCQTYTDCQRQPGSSKRRTSGSAYTPQKPVSEKRIFKKVARSLLSPDVRRSKDIGAMMRNAYGSPLNYNTRDESIPWSVNSPNGFKRVADDMEYDVEWSGDYLVGGPMPTPPKSRKVSRDSRMQGRRSATGLENESNRNSIHVKRNSPRAPSNKMVTIYSDENMNNQSNDSYHRTVHTNARLSSSDPHNSSHFGKNRSQDDKKIGNSFEHYGRKVVTPEDTGRSGDYRENYTEDSYGSGFESLPHKDQLSTHEQLASNEEPTGMLKWCHVDYPSSNARRLSGQSHIPVKTKPLPNQLQVNSLGTNVYVEDSVMRSGVDMRHSRDNSGEPQNMRAIPQYDNQISPRQMNAQINDSGKKLQMRQKVGRTDDNSIGRSQNSVGRSQNSVGRSTTSKDVRRQSGEYSYPSNHARRSSGQSHIPINTQAIPRQLSGNGLGIDGHLEEDVMRVDVDRRKSRQLSGESQNVRENYQEHTPQRHIVNDQNFQAPGSGRNAQSKYSQVRRLDNNQDENIPGTYHDNRYENQSRNIPTDGSFDHELQSNSFKMGDQEMQSPKTVLRGRNLHPESFELHNHILQSPRFQSQEHSLQSPTFHSNDKVRRHIKHADCNDKNIDFPRGERITLDDSETDQGRGFQIKNCNRRELLEGEQARFNGDHVNPRFQSPNYQRTRMRGNTNNHPFSPSGSMAKLRLSTPKDKDAQFSDEPIPRHQNDYQKGCANDDVAYCHRTEDPVIKLSTNRKDLSSDSRTFRWQNSGESYPSARYIENLSDKENEFVEKDRTGFISMDEICSVSELVNVERFNKSPRDGRLGGERRLIENLSERISGENQEGFIRVDRISPRNLSERISGENQEGFIRVDRISPRNLSERISGENQEGFIRVDRISPRNLSERISGENQEGFIRVDRISPRNPGGYSTHSDNVEGITTRRASVSPGGSYNTYTLSGPVGLGVDRSQDSRTDSLKSSHGNRQGNVSQSYSRPSSVEARHRSNSEREMMSSNTFRTNTGIKSPRDENRSKAGAKQFSGGRKITNVEASIGNVPYIDNRNKIERVKTSSNRKREDLLVTAEHQSHDYNVARVRKMDTVTQQKSAKPKIKKSLFVSNRNVATPVNFNEFAQGIITGGEMSEPMGHGQAIAGQSTESQGFKLPFSPSVPKQAATKKMLIRNEPLATKPFQSRLSGYGDVMSSTLREASRRHLSDIRNRAGNFIHSTPMGSRAPLMLNETISTIQAPDEVDTDEVVLI